MPTLQMFIVEGHDDGQKAVLIGALTDAVVTAIGAPPDSVRVILSEVSAKHFAVGGKAVQTVQASMQIFLIAGRSDEQKVRLIGALTEAAVTAIGVERSEARVIISDVPNTDFGLAGATAKSLGRGIGRAEMNAA